MLVGEILQLEFEPLLNKGSAEYDLEACSARESRPLEECSHFTSQGSFVS